MKPSSPDTIAGMWLGTDGAIHMPHGWQNELQSERPESGAATTIMSLVWVLTDGVALGSERRFAIKLSRFARCKTRVFCMHASQALRGTVDALNTRFANNV